MYMKCLLFACKLSFEITDETMENFEYFALLKLKTSKKYRLRPKWIGKEQVINDKLQYGSY